MVGDGISFSKLCDGGRDAVGAGLGGGKGTVTVGLLWGWHCLYLK